MDASDNWRIEHIPGGVTTPAGFRAAGVACHIKASGALDVALVVPDGEASAAGVFTTNLVQAAPVLLSRRHLGDSGGRARAVIINSGCANACTGARGARVAEDTAAAVATAIGCPPAQVLVASTGVIGVDLDSRKVAQGVTLGLEALSTDGGPQAARAIMTTDRAPKEAAVAVSTAVGDFRVGGMAKGAGMIEPRMATMLAVLTCDAQVPPALLDRAMREAVDDTFNAITVDGECSTNDCVFVLAGGAGGTAVDEHAYGALRDGLRAVCRTLAVEIVSGGEGATKLIVLRVTGAADPTEARRAARTLANSLLVKTAIHGGDPNWGRLVAAAGRSGVAFNPDRASVRIGPVTLFRDGQPFDERAPEAASYLERAEVDIEVDLGTGGPHDATMWTCDLSAEYVRINADYRT